MRFPVAGCDICSSMRMNINLGLYGYICLIYGYIWLKVQHQLIDVTSFLQGPVRWWSFGRINPARETDHGPASMGAEDGSHHHWAVDDWYGKSPTYIAIIGMVYIANNTIHLYMIGILIYGYILVWSCTMGNSPTKWAIHTITLWEITRYTSSWPPFETTYSSCSISLVELWCCSSHLLLVCQCTLKCDSTRGYIRGDPMQHNYKLHWIGIRRCNRNSFACV